MDNQIDPPNQMPHNLNGVLAIILNFIVTAVVNMAKFVSVQ